MSAISNVPPKPDAKRLDVFGPHGLRELLRTILRITQSNLAGKYAVHELLSADDIPYSCDEFGMHPNEAIGQNLRPTKDGFWMGIDGESGWSVNAGPINHRGEIVINSLAGSVVIPASLRPLRLVPSLSAIGRSADPA